MAVWKRRDTGKWVCDFRHNGKRQQFRNFWQRFGTGNENGEERLAVNC